MATATVTSKGQITIPVQVRESLGLKAGDRVEFIETEDGQFSIVAATYSAQDLKGFLSKPLQAVSIETMNEAIARQWADQP